MVPLSERDAVTKRAKADAEMRAVYAFLFDEPYAYAAESAFPHADLLKAVASGNEAAFQAEAAGFQKRRTSEGGGWYENDSLVFLLLVGCERFGASPKFLDPILTARERSTNQVAKQVNEVFRALSRKDYGLESPLGFLKLPLLHLAGKLTLSTEAAAKAYGELTQPGLLGSLSPFLQLLALRAYDLVLFARQPQPFENFDTLVGALETYQEKASVRQALRLLWALPYKWWLGGISLVVLVISFFFGLGERAASHEEKRQHPDALQIVASGDALNHELTAVRASARFAYADRPNDQAWAAVAVQTSPLRLSAGKFSVELSIGAGTIVATQAWLVHPGEGGITQTLLPVQGGTQSARAFLTSGEPDDTLVFVVFLRVAQPLSPEQVARAMTLRVLD